ncbi:MAG TPA: toll/interleukin-1 receptor domain-containing protein, partial [Ktedonobacteraceae bacterium]|nr:toll/interleukin-1 receptor domain-containing protein [Ktedonobacteraceae bacterium]
MTMASFSPLTVYYCADPADLAFCQALDLHLSPLKSIGRIQIWGDEQILAGQEREQEREKHLSTAQILVLLLSPDFLASEGGQHQISVALQRHQAEDVVVIPLLVRPCSWQEMGLSALQILPREQKALSTRSHPDEAWQEIVTEISRTIATIWQWVFVV